MFLDIKKSINDILKKTFPEISLIAGEIKEGFERPSFFTYLTPITIQPLHKNYYRFVLLVGIRHYQGEVRTDIDQLEKYSELDKAFLFELPVGENSFLIRDKNFERFTDDYGFEFQFEISARIRTDLLPKEERKRMEELIYGFTED